MRGVSLVVPVKDEGSTIQALIDSISVQTILPKEVIFVDGGSKDDTRKIIKENIERASIRIKLIETERAYPGQARNLGVKESSFDLIAFTDAGIMLDKRWLEELLRPIDEDETVDCVYGTYEPIIDSFVKEASLMAYIPPKEEVHGKAFRTNFIASSLFKKEMFKRAGGFPPFRAAEDKIFMEKVRKTGAKISYAEKAKVYWSIPGSIKGIFRRFSEFSAHDILAGRAVDWHHSVFRTYAVLAISAIMGLLVNRIFLWLIMPLLVIRIGNILRKRRADFKLKFLLDPRYLATIILIIFATDAAMFSGSLRSVTMRDGEYA